MARPPPSGRKGRQPGDVPDSFDQWLDEGLHRLYDDVVNAPLPEALLALIESHREPPTDAPVVTPGDEGHPAA